MNAQRGLAFLADRKELLEATLLIGGTIANYTLGVALDLEHLHQRLEFFPQPPVVSCIGNAIDRLARKG